MKNPLSQTQWQRISELRNGSELTPTQSAELKELLAQADAREAAALEPHNRTLQEKTRELKRQNQQLILLLERRQQLTG